nr:hypothetical protein GCM10020241_53010 [Streptoalloteichus tenebrarius]
MTAGLVAASGGAGTVGGMTLGSSGGATAGSSGAGGSAAGRSVRARKSESREAARRGDADEAWRRLGMRRLRQAARRDLDCLRNSFGEVQRFFARTPCTSLDRMLFAVGDGQNTAVVSVVWVRFPRRDDVRRFRSVMDVHGSGDVRPLGSGLLGMAEIRFTGRHYHPHPNGDTITIAETERLGGTVDDEVLGALAEVASFLPRP